MHLMTLFPLACALALAGCGAAPPTDAAGQPGSTAAASAEAAQPGDAARIPPTTDASRMDDLNRFVPEGARIVDTVRGDLTGAGSDDVVLVVSPAASGDGKLGEGVPRSVLLLTRDATGALRKAAENARLVPCATCGGTAGDPYAFSRIEAGTLTIAVSGGSRERWFDNYVFRYAPAQQRWTLVQVVRGVSDTMTEQRRQIELTGEELGDVAFPDFDPATLRKTATLD